MYALPLPCLFPSGVGRLPALITVINLTNHLLIAHLAASVVLINLQNICKHLKVVFPSTPEKHFHRSFVIVVFPYKHINEGRWKL